MPNTKARQMPYESLTVLTSALHCSCNRSLPPDCALQSCRLLRRSTSRSRLSPMLSAQQPRHHQLKAHSRGLSLMMMAPRARWRRCGLRAHVCVPYAARVGEAEREGGAQPQGIASSRAKMHSTCRICQVRVSLDFKPVMLRRLRSKLPLRLCFLRAPGAPCLCCMAQTASSARRRERSFSTCQTEATGHTLPAALRISCVVLARLGRKLVMNHRSQNDVWTRA